MSSKRPKNKTLQPNLIGEELGLSPSKRWLRCLILGSNIGALYMFQRVLLLLRQDYNEDLNRPDNQQSSNTHYIRPIIVFHDAPLSGSNPNSRKLIVPNSPSLVFHYTHNNWDELVMLYPGELKLPSGAFYSREADDLDGGAPPRWILLSENMAQFLY